MSTAPSSIPPPSFDVAPELPEGVELRARPDSTGWKPWTAWAALVAAFAGALVGALVIGVIGSAAGSSFTDPSPAVRDAATHLADAGNAAHELAHILASAQQCLAHLGTTKPTKGVSFQPLKGGQFSSAVDSFPPRLLTDMTPRRFGISACTATPGGLPPSLAQHGSC